MSDKTQIKATMLALEAQKLAFASQAYEEYLRDSVFGLAEPADAGDASMAVQSAEIAQAFEAPLHEYAQQIETLRAIDFGAKNKVEPGAVLRANGRWFVIAVATDAFECDGQRYIGISSHAPIYRALAGRQAGDEVQFGSARWKIEQVL